MTACNILILFHVYFRAKRILLRKDIHRSHLEMTVVRINVIRKIKTTKEKYIHLLVANTVQTYQIMVSKQMC